MDSRFRGKDSSSRAYLTTQFNHYARNDDALTLSLFSNRIMSLEEAG
jgi:hypothetical protein